MIAQRHDLGIHLAVLHPVEQVDRILALAVATLDSAQATGSSLPNSPTAVAEIATNRNID